MSTQPKPSPIKNAKPGGYHVKMLTVAKVQLGPFPPDRDYGVILQQTQQVYDQLLAAKYNHLMEALLKKKDQLDARVNEVSAKEGQDKALEFGVKAQSILNRMSHDYEKELNDLKSDYQKKLDTMQMVMEQKWRQEHS